MSDYILRSKAIEEFINCKSLVPPSYVVKTLQEIPAADVAPRTKVKDTNEYEDCMSILCEYDYTLNDGYCLLNDIEDFFEIIDNEE